MSEGHLWGQGHQCLWEAVTRAEPLPALCPCLQGGCQGSEGVDGAEGAHQDRAGHQRVQAPLPVSVSSLKRGYFPGLAPSEMGQPLQA